MRDEYDFTDALPNPYAESLRKQVTIRMEQPTLTYFKALSSAVGIPYQTLINLYLRDCAENRRKPKIEWKPLEKPEESE
jgi:predicted DNA binding CopG/RHH family protein